MLLAASVNKRLMGVALPQQGDQVVIEYTDNACGYPFKTIGTVLRTDLEGGELILVSQISLPSIKNVAVIKRGTIKKRTGKHGGNNSRRKRRL